MLVRLFAPHQIIESIDWIIEKVLGKEALDTNMLPIYDIYEMINMRTPLLIISKRGQNPYGIFQKMVDQLGKT